MINKRIKDLRVSKGLSQLELSKAIGVDQSSIGNYERGLRLPDSDTIMNLANYFDVSTDYLLGTTNVMSKAETCVKMREIEALELIKETWKKLVGDYRYQNARKIDTEDAYWLAMSALEKQIPSKVINQYTNHHSNMQGTCAKCNNSVSLFYDIEANCQWCCSCGQKLDWSEDK